MMLSILTFVYVEVDMVARSSEGGTECSTF